MQTGKPLLPQSLMFLLLFCFQPLVLNIFWLPVEKKSSLDVCRGYVGAFETQKAEAMSHYFTASEIQWSP